MNENKILENYTINQDQTEFSYTTFKNSDFSNVDLNSYEFVDCTFIACDLSMALLKNTVLTRVKYKDCKLMGVDFSVCSSFAFSVRFEDSLLNYAYFLKNDLKKTVFKNCIMNESSFFESNLSLAQFINCDLANTIFERCNLSKCDFSTSNNYSISPSENNIKKARFSYPGLLGLLDRLDIIIED